VQSTEHLKPNAQLAADSPYRTQDANLRCHLNKQFLYDLKSRYYEGLRALRPGAEDRVMFAAIAGVPADLVSPVALAKVDFQAQDPASRQAFYDTILADDRMQDTIDPATTTMPGNGTGNVMKSCSRTALAETVQATAFPPRRIVQLAKLFDENGMIQSICQDDFTQPSQAIIAMIARRLEHPCGAAFP
jgi:hypothetical protein